MAAKVRVDLVLPGINTTMKSPGVTRLQRQTAARIAAAAGTGFEVDADESHPWVNRVWVQSATPEARRAEATDKVLTRAVGTARS